MKKTLLFTCAIILLYNLSVFAQVPSFSYRSPNVFDVGTQIKTLYAAGSAYDPGVGYNQVAVKVTGTYTMPYATAADGAGNVYIADVNANKVFKIPPGGNAVSIGSGFFHPSALAVDLSGNVFVADAGSGTIKKITAQGGAVTNFSTGFYNPLGVAVDTVGNVYVSDNKRNTVSKIPAAGGAATVIGTGFNGPVGIAATPGGDVYVADAQNSAIKKIKADGSGTVLVSDLFYFPTGVSVDNAGNVYVADYGYNTIWTLKAVVGKTALASRSPIGIGGKLNKPFGLCIDPFGVLYVAETGTKAVKMLKPTSGFFINRALPNGLVLDCATSFITGTPVVESPTKTYVVVEYNDKGRGDASFSIKVGPHIVPDQASDLAVVDITATSARVTFKDGALSGRAVFLLEGTTGVVDPRPGPQPEPNHPGYTIYQGYVGGANNTAGNSIGGWVCYANGLNGGNLLPNGQIVSQNTKGRADGATLKGLKPNTTYRVTVVEYNQFWTTNPPQVGTWLTQGQYPVNFTTLPNPPTLSAAPVKTNELIGVVQPGERLDVAEPIVNPALSPNNDGRNDVLFIEGISAFAQNKLTILDQSGDKVFERARYDNSNGAFDGHSSINGKQLQAGTYFYVLEYVQNKVSKRKTGYIVMKY